LADAAQLASLANETPEVVALSCWRKSSVVYASATSTPQSTILSAVIFNALTIICLIPLALRGVRYRSIGAAILLRDNLLIYGLGSIIVPFIGIKLIDMILVALPLV
jgi:high-affinity K+ transport system ATPase subunit B